MAEIVFRVDCLDYEGGVWRMIRVGGGRDLLSLSYAVLASFGADGSHMLEMRAGRERFVMFEEDLEEGSGMLSIGRGLPSEGFEASLLEETTVGEVAGEGEKLKLMYDFSLGHEFLFTFVEKSGEGTGDGFEILDGEGRGILEEKSPKEEAEAYRVRAGGGKCILRDADGTPWDPLCAAPGLDTAAVLARARAMIADFYAEDE